MSNQEERYVVVAKCADSQTHLSESNSQSAENLEFVSSSHDEKDQPSDAIRSSHVEFSYAGEDSEFFDEICLNPDCLPFIPHELLKRSINELLDQSASLKGWKLDSLENGVSIYSLDSSRTRSHGVGIINAPGLLVFQLLQTNCMRNLWDACSLHGEVTRVICPSTKIFKTELRDPFFSKMSVNCDILVHARALENNRFLIAAKSIHRFLYKDCSSFNLLDLSGGGFVIEPLRNDPEKCFLHSFMEFDLSYGSFEPCGFVMKVFNSVFSNRVQSAWKSMLMSRIAGVRSLFDHYPRALLELAEFEGQLSSSVVEQQSEDIRLNEDTQSLNTIVFCPQDPYMYATKEFELELLASPKVLTRDETLKEFDIGLEYERLGFQRYSKGGLHFIDQKTLDKHKGFVLSSSFPKCLVLSKLSSVVWEGIFFKVKA
jgi:hypothetical protein